MNKIAMIMPYFGNFPIWIDLFLYSCSRNKFIDFIFFTDCKLPERKYDNIIFNECTFNEYCNIISKKLDINFRPSSPYKLCDVRPFLCHIHREELKEYDFWGYGDIDLIYGDLSTIINEKNLKKDVISTHADRLSGHFTIIRKNSHFSDICWKIRNWKSRLLLEYGDGIDEHDFTSLIFKWHPHIWRLVRIINKFWNIPYTKIFNFFYLFSKYKKYHIKEYYTSPQPKDGEVWIYDNKRNKILNPQHKEIPYLHFLFFKKTPFWNNINYWKEGFWQLQNGQEEKCNFILFTNEFIKGVENI